MLIEDKVIEIFVMADDFSKIFLTQCSAFEGLDKPKDGRKRDYHRDCRVAQAEIIVIMIMFPPRCVNGHPPRPSTMN